MTTQRDETFDSPLIGSSTIDAAIRIGLLGLLLYWSLKVIGPFLTIALWSAILTVALYPLFDWLAARLGSRRLAAMLTTLLCLVIVIGPVTWLGFGLIGSVDFVVRGFDSKIFSIPSPADSVRDWPLIGEPAYRLWTLAATDIKTILLEVLPNPSAASSSTSPEPWFLVSWSSWRRSLFPDFSTRPDRVWPARSGRSCAESSVNAARKC
jgi:predicted PurR-regulated permease PerM